MSIEAKSDLLCNIAESSYKVLIKAPKQGLRDSLGSLEEIVAARKWLEKTEDVVARILAMKLQNTVDSAVINEMYRKERKKHGRAPKETFKSNSFDTALLKRLLKKNDIDEHMYIDFALALDTEIARFCRENNYTANDFLTHKVFEEAWQKLMIPVIIGITTSKGKDVKKIWIKQKEEMFEFEVNEKPLMVRFDEGNYLLKEWTFNKKMDELLYQLKNDDLIGKIWAASELVKFKEDTLVAEELKEMIQNDSFWAVRRSALEALSEVEVDANIELLKKVCEEKNSKVRTTALQILGDMKDSELASFFVERFEKENSYAAQAEALRSLGKCGDRSQISFLKDAAEMESPRDVIKRAADWALKELMKGS